MKDKKHRKVRDHCHYTREYRGAARSISNSKYSVPKKIPIVFHNGSNNDYHFVIKEFDDNTYYTLLLADVFENFRNMCLEIYELDPAKFLSVPGLEWQAALKQIKVKLFLLIDIDMLLMVGKGVRGRLCHSIYRYARANSKYMND